MTQLKKYFENLLEPQVLAILLIVLAACIVLTMIFGQKVNGFKENKSKFYTYVFSLAFIYSIIAFLGFNKLFMNKELHEFIFYQVSSLVLGIIHCRLYRSYLQKFNDDKKLTEYLFALIAALYSLIPFGLIYTLLNGSQFLSLMLGHYLLFFVPTLFNDTFNRAMSIPPRIYKTWQFPQNYKQLAGVSDEEMRDLVVFSFMIDKGEFSEKYNVYRAKGPTRLDFGRLFYNFVLDYNERHSESPIEIEGKNGLYNWVFFLQPKWYETTKYIDPELTLYMNGIEENSVVFCVRSEQLGEGKETKEEEQKIDFEFNSYKENKRSSQAIKKANDSQETIS